MARSRTLTGLDKSRLRRWLMLFFVALALPTAVLVRQAYTELKWEAFHQYRLQAEELAIRIDKGYQQLIQAEEARPFTDFSFLNVLGDSTANFLQRSELASFPVKSEIPGLIGYFQIDTQGRFSSPLLPPERADAQVYGVPDNEYQQRLQLSLRIQQILSSNSLVSTTRPSSVELKIAEADNAGREWDRADTRQSIPSAESTVADRFSDAASPTPKEEPEVQGQAAFDLLEKSILSRAKRKEQQGGFLGRVEDLKLDSKFQSATEEASSRLADSTPTTSEKRVRKERSALPMTGAPKVNESSGDEYRNLLRIPVRTFESELDPYRFSLLASGEFVMFRKVWRDGERYIQGMLIDRQAFLEDVVQSMFAAGVLSQMSDLLVAYQGDLVSVFNAAGGSSYLARGEGFHGSLLLQRALSAPLDGLTLIFSITNLPMAAGGHIILWSAAVLLLVLCGGFLLMYRLGLGQIALAQQQQDFVSAVSHELKTPLTSIRMYGEMLMEGWVSEEKRQSYYRYIASEGERLSRLIENVLQLARMNRNEQRVVMLPKMVSELVSEIGPRVTSQAEHAGFDLTQICDPAALDVQISVDSDCLTQVLINLVDNAIKFSAKAERKLIELGCRRDVDGRLLLSVRDHGPGVARDQAKKIFRMFYRSESEMTRETAGTGIGLALVRQLLLAMNASVEVVNRDPGAEFVISFPVCEQVPTDLQQQ